MKILFIETQLMKFAFFWDIVLGFYLKLHFQFEKLRNLLKCHLLLPWSRWFLIISIYLCYLNLRILNLLFFQNFEAITMILKVFLLYPWILRFKIVQFLWKKLHTLFFIYKNFYPEINFLKFYKEIETYFLLWWYIYIWLNIYDF